MAALAAGNGAGWVGSRDEVSMMCSRRVLGFATWLFGAGLDTACVAGARGGVYWGLDTGCVKSPERVLWRNRREI